MGHLHTEKCNTHPPTHTQQHRYTQPPPPKPSALKAHAAGQGGTHKYTERCRDTDTKGYAHEGEARCTTRH